MSEKAERHSPCATAINRLWRRAMTGVCFSLFGLGGLVLSVVWFNLLLLVQRNPLRRRQWARRSISFSFRCFLRTTRALGVLDYRIEGAEQLRRDRRCLVVANHPSLIDYVLLASVMPDVDCLVKADLQRNIFVSGVIRSASYLVNSQAETLLPDCQQRLDNGDAIMIFPEGTRTRYGEPLKLQRGAANITQPQRETMQVCIEGALKMAGLTASDIGYINAHGTATERGDVAESLATAAIFGDATPVSSFKSYFGHTLGACGALEAWLSIEMMLEGWFAPTLNLTDPAEDCGKLDYIMHQPREVHTDYVQSNNFAFGGINTSLIFRRWTE